LRVHAAFALSPSLSPELEHVAENAPRGRAGREEAKKTPQKREKGKRCSFIATIGAS